MKIGIDARMYSPKFTGIGRYTYELLQWLLKVDNSHSYVVFVNEEGNKLIDDNNSRVKKVFVNAKHYSFAEQTRFLQAIKKEKCDLVHFTHFNAPLLYRGKSVVTIHDLTLSFFPGSKMNTFLHRMAYNAVIRSATKHANHIIAVSKHTKKDLKNLLHIDDQKISVIYEGVDQSFFRSVSDEEKKQVKHKYNLENDFFLYTGVLREHKNVDGLIKAFSQYIHSSGDKIDLAITGRDDPKYAHIKELPKKLHIEDRVKFLGLVPEKDLIELYHSAYAYTFPSFYEGFGLPPLESMASKTPVLASNASCIPEICGENNALFFDPRNMSSIVEQMNTIRNNKDTYNQLIENGTKRVHEFSWEEMAKETLKIYNNVVA